MKPAAFLSEFRAEDIAEGRETDRLRMLEPFKVYSAVLDDEVEVAAGFEIDGESIPLAARGVVKPFGQSKRGAAVHDWLYRHHGYWRADGTFIPVTREQADAVYHELVTLGGLPRWRANNRWLVLRLVGWRAWNTYLAILLLTGCTQDIAGIPRNDRLALYSTALLATGHPAASTLVYALRRPVTQAKQPVNGMNEGRRTQRIETTTDTL